MSAADWTPQEPTPEQCSAHEPVSWDAGPNGTYRGFACWYPQMGGYVGRCVVEILGDGSNNECFDAWVWHDGVFPFTGESSDDPPRGPVRLHHCMAQQFVVFGELVEQKMSESRR